MVAVLRGAVIVALLQALVARGDEFWEQQRQENERISRQQDQQRQSNADFQRQQQLEREATLGMARRSTDAVHQKPRLRIWSEGVPRALLDKLGEILPSEPITGLSLGTEGQFVLTWGRNGYAGNMPPSMLAALKTVNKRNDELRSVSLVPGGWLFLKRDNEIEHCGLNPAFVEDLIDISSANRRLDSVTVFEKGVVAKVGANEFRFSDSLPKALSTSLRDAAQRHVSIEGTFGTSVAWLVSLSGGKLYRGQNLPRQLEATLEKVSTIERVALAPNGSWIVIGAP